MQLFFILSGAAVLALVVFIIIKKKGAAIGGETDLPKYLATLEGFSSAKDFLGADGIHGIAMDERNKKICLITKKAGFLSRIISYKDILAVEIVEDEYPIMKAARRSGIDAAERTNRSEGAMDSPSNEMPAAKDAAISMVAEMSGEKVTVRTIALNVVVKNMQEPIHTVVFSNKEIEKGSVGHTITLTAARQWYSRLYILIQQADNEDENAMNQSEQCNTNRFVADEIAKLAELMQAGLITEEEFNLQKAKLLANDSR